MFKHSNVFFIQIPDVTTVCLDLSDWNATKQALKELGPIDLLVNNAGFSIIGPFHDVTEEEFDKYNNR